MQGDRRVRDDCSISRFMRVESRIYFEISFDCKNCGDTLTRRTALSWLMVIIIGFSFVYIHLGISQLGRDQIKHETEMKLARFPSGIICIIESHEDAGCR